MSISVKLWNRFEAVKDNGTPESRGGATLYEVPSRIDGADGESYETRAVVADNYSKVTLWQNGDAGVDGFDFLWIETDETVLVELTLDRTGSADPLVLTVTPELPLMLGSNKGVASSTSDSSQTTTSTIEQVDVQRNVADGEGDAEVRLLMVT